MAKKDSANKTVSLALLESYRKSLYAIKDFLDRASKDIISIDDIELQLKISLGVTNLGKSIGPAIESLDKLEDKVQKEEALSTKRKGTAESSLFEA